MEEREIEQGIEKLKEEIRGVSRDVQALSINFARFDERITSLQEFQRKTEASGQRVPVLLLGAISAASGAVSVLFQLWLRGP